MWIKLNIMAYIVNCNIICTMMFFISASKIVCDDEMRKFLSLLATS